MISREGKKKPKRAEIPQKMIQNKKTSALEPQHPLHRAMYLCVMPPSLRKLLNMGPVYRYLRDIHNRMKFLYKTRNRFQKPETAAAAAIEYLRVLSSFTLVFSLTFRSSAFGFSTRAAIKPNPHFPPPHRYSTHPSRLLPLFDIQNSTYLYIVIFHTYKP